MKFKTYKKILMKLKRYLNKNSTMKERSTDIVILGAGIAGYEAYRTLVRLFKKHTISKTITIIDQNNYFTFTPLLHEVAAGAVLPSHASFAIREIVAKTPHQFICGTVQHIDTQKKIVTTTNGTIVFDMCIVALGSISNLYGVPGAKEHTFQVRTLSEAITLNQAIICKLEDTERTSLTINVIGGGYTGVEIASELAQLNKEEIHDLYPHISVTINILQSGDTLVPYLPAKARNKITDRLQFLGVRILTNTPVCKITSAYVYTSETEKLPNDITVWVTGFTTNAPLYFDNTYIERDRVRVTNTLQLADTPDTYVIGDMAYIRDPDNDDIIYPQLGEAAHHAGMYVAKHITNRLRNKTTPHFHFKSKGQLMPVGEWYGIGIFGPFVFSGKFMWWLRRTVYVLFMPGCIRKLRIIADWTFISKGRRHLTRIHKK